MNLHKLQAQEYANIHTREIMFSFPLLDREVDIGWINTIDREQRPRLESKDDNDATAESTHSHKEYPATRSPYSR